MVSEVKGVFYLKDFKLGHFGFENVKWHKTSRLHTSIHYYVLSRCWQNPAGTRLFVVSLWLPSFYPIFINHVLDPFIITRHAFHRKFLKYIIFSKPCAFNFTKTHCLYIFWFLMCKRPTAQMKPTIVTWRSNNSSWLVLIRCEIEYEMVNNKFKQH